MSNKRVVLVHDSVTVAVQHVAVRVAKRGRTVEELQEIAAFGQADGVERDRGRRTAKIRGEVRNQKRRVGRVVE